MQAIQKFSEIQSLNGAEWYCFNRLPFERWKAKDEQQIKRFSRFSSITKITVDMDQQKATSRTVVRNSQRFVAIHGPPKFAESVVPPIRVDQHLLIGQINIDKTLIAAALLFIRRRLPSELRVIVRLIHCIHSSCIQKFSFIAKVFTYGQSFLFFLESASIGHVPYSLGGIVTLVDVGK